MAKKRADIIDHSYATDVSMDEYPQWLRDRLEWFQDMKFGLMTHWGPYSQWGCIESWPLVEADTWARPDDLKPWIERGKDLERFRRDYRALNRTFNPTQFDPAVWAEAAKLAGMKYFCFTTKHHDGFCMFDTKTTDYRVTHQSCPFHSHPRANIARVAFDTFRERGFAISCYFSKSDWHTPYYWDPELPAHDRNPNYDTHQHPEQWAKFVDFVHRQVEELMTRYGHIDALWLDGGQVRPPDQDIQMACLAEMARSHQPGLIMVDRTVGGTYENVLTPEQQIPNAPLNHPWESCLTMGKGWSFRPDDEYKPARTLIHMLADIACKGGNFLLNVGASPEGTFAEAALDRLREIGDWMAVNAEAIHGTRAVAPYKERNVCFTRKGEWVYGIVLAGEGKERPPARVRLSAIVPAPGSEVFLLGRDRPLTWHMVDGRAEISLRFKDVPCQHAWVLKFRPHTR